MSHFARIRVNLTAWSTGAVAPAEFNQIDANLAAAINGDAGGTWAPTNPIILGGLGMEFASTLIANGSVILRGDEVVIQSDALRVVGVTPDFQDGIRVSAGTSTFVSDVEIDGNTAINGTNLDFFGTNFRVHSSATFQAIGDVILGNGGGGDITINGIASFEASAIFDYSARFNDVADFWGPVVTLHTNTTLNCNGPVSLNDDVTLGDGPADIITINGPLTANSTAEFWGNFSVHSTGYMHALGDSQLGSSSLNSIQLFGTTTLRAPLTYADTGRIPQRGMTGPNADHTFSVADGNTVRIPSAGAGPLDYTISDTGATDGDFFEFWLLDNTIAGNSIAIRGPTGLIAEMFVPAPTAPTGPFLPWCKVMRISGSWQLLGGVNV